MEQHDKQDKLQRHQGRTRAVVVRVAIDEVKVEVVVIQREDIKPEEPIESHVLRPTRIHRL